MARKQIKSVTVSSDVRDQLNANFLDLYTGYVPYVGATTGLNLGTYSLTAPTIYSVNDLTIDCGSEKTVVLVEPVWDDIRIIPSSFDFAGNADPVIVNFRPGGSGTIFKLWEFAKGDEAFFSCQLPHGYKVGADIKAHVHWTAGARGNEEAAKAVAWKVDYTWCNIHGTFSPSATVDLTDTVTGTDYYHEITSDVSITGTDKGLSSMIIGRIYREDVVGDTWVGTASGSLPLLLELDFHVPLDTIGSRTNITK